jgi:phospholipid/cholesterol/gamma-HCH transport system substrate-binding protein
MGRQTKVGLLILVAIAILIVTTLSLGQGQHFWERKVNYEIHLVRTNGLQEGAQVSLSGVPVGSVTDLRFPSDLSVRYIVVTLRIATDVAPRIRTDTVAAVRTFGLLGDRYVELTPGSPEAQPVEPGGLIASIDPVDYESLLGQGNDAVTNIVEVTSSLRDVLGTIQRGEGLLGAMVRNREFGEQTLRDLQQSLANVQTTSNALANILQRVERGEGVLGYLVHDSKESRELLGNLNRSAKSLDRLTMRLSSSRGTLARLIDDEEYAKRLLTNLDHTTQNLAEITAKINHGDGTLGRLVNDPTVYNQAKGLLGGASKSWFLRFFAGAPPPAGPSAAPAPEAARP